MDNFKITKREVIASISIVAIMLLIGVLISSKISDWVLDKNAEYNKAVKIDSLDLFEYGMRTNVGNAFVYGDLLAVDTVTYPEIGGSYMYVEKVKERYTKHTRQVAHTKTVNGKTQTYYTTETYWTWDRVSSEDKKCNEISFLGHVLPTEKINIPGSNYIDTIKESYYIRYKYYGTSAEFTGTIYTKLADETITDGTSFYNNMTIDDTVDMLETNAPIYIFWAAWIVLIGFAVYGFYYIDNRWLEE